MIAEQRPYQPRQLSFLPPEDVEILHRLRHLVSEAEQLYYPRGLHAEEGAPIFMEPVDIDAFFRPLMAQLPQEQVRVANLSAKHQVLSSHMIYQGTLLGATIRPAEVLRPAVIENAAFIVLAHNHPSGDAEPSRDDIRVTQQVVEAGGILGIPLLDHLVIGRTGFVSLAQRRVISPPIRI